jgi:cell division protease FtsH
MATEKKHHINFWYLVAAIMLIMLFQQLLEQGQQVDRLFYSEFQAYLAEGSVAEITVTDDNNRDTLRAPDANGLTRFVTARVETLTEEELGALVEGAIIGDDVRATS